MSAREALSALAQRYWDFKREESPITGIMAGAPADTTDLLREAPEDHERRARLAAGMLAELDGVDLAALNGQDLASAKLLRWELDALVDMTRVKGHLRPCIYPMGPDFIVTYFTSATALATADDARDFTARLRSVPKGLDGVIRSIRMGIDAGVRYPRLVVTRAVEQCRGQISPPPRESALYAPFARPGRRTDAFNQIAREAEEVVRDLVYPAYEAYARFLDEEVGACAVDGVSCVESPDGEAFYRSLVRQYATIDPAPDVIHQIGLDEVARITGLMEGVAAEAGMPGDLPGFIRRIKSDNALFEPSGEALRERIEILSKRIDARMPEYFGRLPRTTYGVRSIPEAIAEKMPPAYAQPNPADNSASGVHWITSIPAKCPSYMHIPLALHEAWPGHLMHLALIQEMDQLPDFRRHGAMGYSACLEGWALYCERLGEELGFYDTPEKQYGRLEMEMWRAVRLVVDTGMHWKRWSRAEAVAYMSRYMAMPSSTIEAEIDRYIGMPGQALAYQLGNLKFCEIRARAEAALGDDFRIRDFHDALMAAGPVTLPVLEEIMTDWIAARAEPQTASAA